MAIELTVPKLGLTMEEATLVCWRAASGEMVKKEQIVLVLETDKVTFEMPSPGEGLLHPVAATGSRIEVSEVVGYLAADKDELASLSARHPAAETGGSAATTAAATRPAAAAEPPAAPTATAGRAKASPVARVRTALRTLASERKSTAPLESDARQPAQTSPDVEPRAVHG